MKIIYERHQGGYLVRPEPDRMHLSPILVQTDWDRPGLARTFGWDGRTGDPTCDHRGTDGTIRCPDCGTPPEAFIRAATEYLDANEGMVVDDPGYFE